MSLNLRKLTVCVTSNRQKQKPAEPVGVSGPNYLRVPAYLMKAPPPTREARDGDGGDDDETSFATKTILRLLPRDQIKCS